MSEGHQSTDRMDPQLKAQWLEALRSGKYVQTTGQLHNAKGFCCLGVLCNVVDPNAWDDGDEWVYGEGENTTRDMVELPAGFKMRAKLSGSFEHKLVQMNDEQGMSFAEIADFIERNL